MVVFDSTVEPYHGRGFYAVGAARALSGDDLERGLKVCPGAASRDATPVTRDEVTGDSPYRLYQATVSQAWVLCPRGPREPCSRHGLARDHRTPV